MLTQALDLSNLGTTVGSSTGNTSSANATDPQASQDRFLKLLVAQLSNQDPLNPMDNAQTTTQMAQINTVSGIQELNATLKGMAQQYSAMQALQGTSLIGRQALVDGSQLAFDGEVGKGAISLDSPASAVSVDIMGTNGERIDTVELGALGRGAHAFTWDAAGLDPSRVGSFQIRATQGGQAVPATPLMRLDVSSVSFSSGAMSLQLQDGRNLAYDQVRAFM
jgi:flagellar basal-body rod modification protein FlgD